MTAAGGSVYTVVTPAALNLCKARAGGSQGGLTKGRGQMLRSTSALRRLLLPWHPHMPAPSQPRRCTSLHGGKPNGCFIRPLQYALHGRACMGRLHRQKAGTVTWAARWLLQRAGWQYGVLCI